MDDESYCKKDDLNYEIEYRILKRGTTWIIMSEKGCLNEGRLE